MIVHPFCHAVNGLAQQLVAWVTTVSFVRTETPAMKLAHNMTVSLSRLYVLAELVCNQRTLSFKLGCLGRRCRSIGRGTEVGRVMGFDSRNDLKNMRDFLPSKRGA
jgi:hypothetical protein